MVSTNLHEGEMLSFLWFSQVMVGPETIRRIEKDLGQLYINNWLNFNEENE